MHAGEIATAVRYSGTCAEAVLSAVLLIRRRWRTLPAFCLLIALDLVAASILLLAARLVSPSTFRYLYVGYEILFSGVQLAVLYEIARSVLRPAGIWNRSALRPLIWITLLFTLCAAGMALLIRAPQLSSSNSFELREEIFTGLLTVGTVVAMMFSASQVGLPWRSHAMAIGQGLMVWTLVGVSILSAVGFIDPHKLNYQLIYYLRSGAYLLTVAYWCVALWRNEPPRRPISPALREYIVALHEQVNYDLGKIQQ